MKLIPNPEYALAEYEQTYIYSPAVPKSKHRQDLLPKRWRSKDHEAVMKAWKANDSTELDRLCVPSHVAVEE